MTDLNALIQPDRGQKAIAIHLVAKPGLDAVLRSLNEGQRAAIAAQKFEGAAGELAIVPDGLGWFALGGIDARDALGCWCLARLAEGLPGGTYRVVAHASQPGVPRIAAALVGWIAAQYRFDRYKTDGANTDPRVLLTTEVKALAPAVAEAGAIALVRDLVNTPAEDMGPAQLETEARSLAKSFGAEIHVVAGDALERDYPMVHAVGRAASRHHAPRLIELEWGDVRHPRVAVVGKGVCFDSGGLDIKPSSGMALMKKDMGGAAHALALARLVMEHALPVRLHLLIPAVENAISGNAMRPGDVLRSRQGLSIEITNTDAEGRLVLGDALTRASAAAPELLIDFATLTGAARVALGPDLPAVFTRRDDTAAALATAGLDRDDPVWRLPLHDGYREYLKSDVADMVNSHATGFAGATVAALFLDRFVGEGIDWVHYDTFAWRPTAKPGRPKGGEALGLRAAWGLLLARFERAT
ncbi:leucyl aminopeptidase family protein [Novosphingobium sp.]|uniref:leucyl aminopeptidase family protein n=1 Tax=Novosphingobium sp. TaxID=1874826 RepID=UPI003342BE73